MDAFKWLGGYLKKYLLLIICCVTGALLVSIIEMIPPYIMGQIVDNVIEKMDTSKLFFYLLILIGSVLLFNVVHYLHNFGYGYLGQSVVKKITTPYFILLLNKSPYPKNPKLHNPRKGPEVYLFQDSDRTILSD